MTKAHKITKIKMKAYVLIFHLIQNIKYYNSMLINRKKTLFSEKISLAYLILTGGVYFSINLNALFCFLFTTCFRHIPHIFCNIF